MHVGPGCVGFNIWYSEGDWAGWPPTAVLVVPNVPTEPTWDISVGCALRWEARPECAKFKAMRNLEWGFLERRKASSLPTNWGALPALFWPLESLLAFQLLQTVSRGTWHCSAFDPPLYVSPRSGQIGQHGVITPKNQFSVRHCVTTHPSWLTVPTLY